MKKVQFTEPFSLIYDSAKVFTRYLIHVGPVQSRPYMIQAQHDSITPNTMQANNAKNFLVTIQARLDSGQARQQLVLLAGTSILAQREHVRIKS